MPGFTEVVDELLTLEEFQTFQSELVTSPEKGDLIQGTGGARKSRVRYGTTGKSGGARAIYHYVDSKQRIWLLAIYPKSKQENLTSAQTSMIRQIVAEIKKYERGG